MTARPPVRVRPWQWRDKSGQKTPGIAIFQGQYVRAHLTPDQAINLANKLVDLAEQIEQRGEK